MPSSDNIENIEKDYQNAMLAGAAGEKGGALCNKVFALVAENMKSSDHVEKLLGRNAALDKENEKFAREGVAIRSEVSDLKKQLTQKGELLEQRKAKYEKTQAKKVEMWSRIKELEPMVADIKSYEKRTEKAEVERDEAVGKVDGLVKDKFKLETKLNEVMKSLKREAKNAMTLQLRLDKAEKKIADLSAEEKPKAKKPAAKKTATKKPATKKAAAKPKKEEVKDEK